MAEKRQRGRGNPILLLMRIPVPWVFVLTYAVGAVLSSLRPFRAGAGWLPGVSIAGGALFAVGGAIAGWSWMIFRKARTTTVPGRTSSKLVTWGPYRFSRNPMYVGMVGAYAGEAGILQQLWPVLLLPAVIGYVNWVVIPVEEARLAEVFGEIYEQYRAKVRRWI